MRMKDGLSPQMSVQRSGTMLEKNQLKKLGEFRLKGEYHEQYHKSDSNA